MRMMKMKGEMQRLPTPIHSFIVDIAFDKFGGGRDGGRRRG